MSKLLTHHFRNISNEENNKTETSPIKNRRNRRFSDDATHIAQIYTKTHSKFGRGISYDKSVMKKTKSFLPQISTQSSQQKNIANVKTSLINTTNNSTTDGRSLKRNLSERRFIQFHLKLKNDLTLKSPKLNENIHVIEDDGPYKKTKKFSFAVNSKHSFFTNAMKKKVPANTNNENEPENDKLPYALKKNNPRSSVSVFNASKVKVLPKNIVPNLSTENHKTPIKIKELSSAEELVKGYKYKSQAGKAEGNIPKTNQDNYLINYEINGIKNFNMFGVLDGHGYNGHLASAFVSNYIKNAIADHPEIKKLTDAIDIYHKLKEENYKIIKDTYIQAEKELTHAEFDCNFSGTTCVIVFQCGYRIICANTGDSRAILVSKLGGHKCEPIALSNDHKPNIDTEKKRIYRNKGRVEQYTEFGIKTGPFRVWLKNEMYPGLAMSRSIGDIIASSVGVIAEPEIIEYFINTNTKYIMLASDGVWEFLSNETVMKIGNKHYENNDAIGLCDDIIAEATKHWEKEDVVVDDITVVVVFF